MDECTTDRKEKPVLDVVIEMVRVLFPDVQIRLMVPNEKFKTEVQTRLRQQNVYLPEEHRRSITGVDFNFNCYGECPSGFEAARHAVHSLAVDPETHRVYALE